MDRPLRVFISHTSELARLPPSGTWVEAADRGVRRMGHAPERMADFAASPDPPATLCEQKVRDADLVVALVGFRYGSPVRERPEVSYVELELATARDVGIPVLAFLLADDVEGSRELLVEPDRDHAVRQEELRQRLQQETVRVLVSSPAGLEAAVIHALSGRMVSDQPSEVTGPTGSGERPGLVEAYERGRAAEDAGRLLGAANAYREVIRLDVDYSDAVMRWASCLDRFEHGEGQDEESDPALLAARRERASRTQGILRALSAEMPWPDRPTAANLWIVAQAMDENELVVGMVKVDLGMLNPGDAVLVVTTNDLCLATTATDTKGWQRILDSLPARYRYESGLVVLPVPLVVGEVRTLDSGWLIRTRVDGDLLVPTARQFSEAARSRARTVSRLLDEARAAP